MRRTLMVGPALAVSWLFVPAPAPAQVTVGADVAVNSAYMWRSLLLRNAVVLQPSAYVTAGGFTLGIWQNWELTDPCAVIEEPAGLKADCGGGKFDVSLRSANASGNELDSRMSELDLFGWYSGTIGEEVEFTVGFLVYTFPATAFAKGILDTEEFFGSLSITPRTVPITFGLFASYDFNNYVGLYLEPSVSYSRSLTPNVEVGLAAAAGFSLGDDWGSSGLFNPAKAGQNDQSFLFAENGLTGAQFSINVPITIPTRGPATLSVTPAAYYTLYLDDFLKWLGTTSVGAGEVCDFDFETGTGQTGGCASGRFWGGVTASVSFPVGRGGQ